VGNPVPAKFWSKEGSQELMFPGHSSDDGRITVAADGKLTVANVHGDVDHGYYVCSALNAAGSNIAKAYLKVSGRSMLTQPPPIIAQGPANQTLPLNSLAILPCKAFGHTRPHITWLKGNQPLADQADKYNLLSSGALQIHNLIMTDSDIYTCKAKNADGETTWSASLMVESPTDPKVTFRRMPEPASYPSAPSKPLATDVNDTSISLRWTVPNKEGASTITGYLLQYFSPELGQTWFNVADYVPSTEWTVTGLRPASSYVFVVRAENEQGIGEPSFISNIVRTNGNARGGGQQVQPALTSLISSEANADFDLQLARTRLGAEQLVKLLEVKTINSTAVKLFWKVGTVGLIQCVMMSFAATSCGAVNRRLLCKMVD
jgi:roundabout axon guidance receptor 2